MLKSKLAQRLLGLFVFVGGCYFTYDEMMTVVFEDYYHRAAVLFPGMAVVALGLIFFPLDYERYKAERGIEKPNGFHDLPDSWKLLTILGIAVSVVFWFFLANAHRPEIHPFLLRILS